MNIKELKNGIENHKKRSPSTYNENINITLPLYIIHQKIFSGISQIQEKRHGITNIELDVLASLVMGGGDDYTLSPTQLYDRLLFSSGGMTKVLKRLEDKGYIIRLENSGDKRSKLVRLTSKGKETSTRVLKDVIAYETKYFDCLDKDEKENFKNLLFKVLENTD
ncbi:MAG: MarR family winged helix-turn-helix transcriptional regulator [Arcobacter sp.]|uniref:MarR family winged helix-turn-helix transcriptional regulator n=1 Tax=Arcobacter sp. TaxID=1872629 RepID=UPI003AFF7353